MGFYLIPPTTAGEAIYEVTIFESVAAGAGAVTLPTGASVRLDAWAAGVDALVSTITGGRPDFRTPLDAGGNAVTSTLDAAGNYALSAAPAGGYPVAVIYVVRVALASYVLWTAAMRDQVLDIVGLHDLPAPAAGDLVFANAEPRWASLAHPGGAEYVVESTGASVQWGATTDDGETNPSTVLRADASGYLRLARLGLGTAPSYRLHAVDTFATTGTANTLTALIDSTVTGDGSGGSATHQALALDLDDDTTGDAANYTYVQPFYLYLNTVAGNRKRAYAQRIVVDSTAAGTNAQVYGSYIQIVHSANTGTLPSLGGVLSVVTLDTAGATVTDVSGVTGQPFVSANVTTSKITGVYANATITNGSHTELHLFEGRLYFATGTLGTFRGLDLTDFTHASGTITTGYGVDIGEVPGTTAYGLRSAVTAGANQWNIYASGTADNYLEGDTGIGINAPAARLHVDQASTTGAIPVATFDQADIDQVLMKIIGTAEAASADRTLVADSDFGTPGALVGWIQIEIQDDGNRVADADYYVPFYAVPT